MSITCYITFINIQALRQIPCIKDNNEPNVSNVGLVSKVQESRGVEQELNNVVQYHHAQGHPSETGIKTKWHAR